MCLRERGQPAGDGPDGRQREGGSGLVGAAPPAAGLGRALPAPGRPPSARTIDAPGGEDLPLWFPAPVAGATQIVLLIIDGLGAEQLGERHMLAPTLSGGTGGQITTVAPSTTACALTTLVTGRVPAEHGVVGYRVGARRRGDERPAVVRARCRRPHAGAGTRLPAVPGVPRLARDGARRDAPGLRTDRLHRGAFGSGRAAPLAHARGSRHRRTRAGRPWGALRLRLLRGHRQGGACRGARAVLRRRAARGRPAGGRRAGGVAARRGARGDRRPRPGRRGQFGRGPRARDHA